MRTKTFVTKTYFLTDNPFPSEAIVSWGGTDKRSNGSLYSKEVFGKQYEEAVVKFIVNPVDSGSKFHFLWSLGSGKEARGFGKTATLHDLARTVDADLGFEILSTHEFDEQEARQTPILASMAAFNAAKVTTLAAVSLEHVKYLLQADGQSGCPLERVRQLLIARLSQQTGGTPPESRLPKELTTRVEQEDLQLKGNTVATVDRTFLEHFANGDFDRLLQLVNNTSSRTGYEFLHSLFVIGRAAGVKRIFLLIDEVEAFANADIPRKRRHMEVERFRDLAIETQPFGEMATYVLTMHPDAARTVEEFWSLARLPKLDPYSKQNSRVTVILRELRNREEVESLVRTYLDKFRTSDPPPQPVFPFAPESLDILREASEGRPGAILTNAHKLIEYGVEQKWSSIEPDDARGYFAEEAAREPTDRRRKTIGTID